MSKPYIPNDKWSRKAAEEGYRARSVYKLMELDHKMRLLKPGMKVLDVGAAPGSWLQYASERVGPGGKVVGFDLTEIEPVAENVSTYVQDMLDEPGVNAILEKEGLSFFNVVLSDIAPNTSGVKDVDQWRSVELTTAVFAFADKHLRSGGRCVVKVFRGADFDELIQHLHATWDKVRVTTVQASRERSNEVYVAATKR